MTMQQKELLQAYALIIREKCNETNIIDFYENLVAFMGQNIFKDNLKAGL